MGQLGKSESYKWIVSEFTIFHAIYFLLPTI